MAEIKRNILQYEKEAGRRLPELRRLFNLRAGAKRKRKEVRKDQVLGTECLCDAEWEHKNIQYEHCDARTEDAKGKRWCFFTSNGQAKACRDAMKGKGLMWSSCEASNSSEKAKSPKKAKKSPKKAKSPEKAKSPKKPKKPEKAKRSDEAYQKLLEASKRARVVDMKPSTFVWGNDTYKNYDVGADGNCFFYAVLRATYDKGLEPGKSLLTDDTGVQQTFAHKEGQYREHGSNYENKEFIVTQKERAAMLKFRRILANKLKSYDPAKGTCHSVNNNYLNLYPDVEDQKKQVTMLAATIQKVNEWVDDVDVVRLFIECMYDIKVRVFNGFAKKWHCGEDVDPKGRRVITLYYTGSHYRWLDHVERKTKDLETLKSEWNSTMEPVADAMKDYKRRNGKYSKAHLTFYKTMKQLMDEMNLEKERNNLKAYANAFSKNLPKLRSAIQTLQQELSKTAAKPTTFEGATGAPKKSVVPKKKKKATSKGKTAIQNEKTVYHWRVPTGAYRHRDKRLNIGEYKKMKVKGVNDIEELKDLLTRVRNFDLGAFAEEHEIRIHKYTTGGVPSGYKHDQTLPTIAFNARGDIRILRAVLPMRQVDQVLDEWKRMTGKERTAKEIRDIYDNQDWPASTDYKEILWANLVKETYNRVGRDVFPYSVKGAKMKEERELRKLWESEDFESDAWTIANDATVKLLQKVVSGRMTDPDKRPSWPTPRVMNTWLGEELLDRHYVWSGRPYTPSQSSDEYDFRNIDNALRVHIDYHPTYSSYAHTWTVIMKWDDERNGERHAAIIPVSVFQYYFMERPWPGKRGIREGVYYRNNNPFVRSDWHGAIGSGWPEWNDKDDFGKPFKGQVYVTDMEEITIPANESNLGHDEHIVEVQFRQGDLREDVFDHLFTRQSD